MHESYKFIIIFLKKIYLKIYQNNIFYFYFLKLFLTSAY
jgi:hypothetical protein